MPNVKEESINQQAFVTKKQANQCESEFNDDKISSIFLALFLDSSLKIFSIIFEKIF